MSVTADSIGAMDLDDLVEQVNGIYISKDTKRSLWDVWMHANHHAAGVAEEIRKQNLGEPLARQVADFALWLFTMVWKLRGEIGVRKEPDAEQESVIRIERSCSEMLWSRFPRMCPFCYWRRSRGEQGRENEPGFDAVCDCMEHPADPLNSDQKRSHARTLTLFASRTVEHKPASIDEWQHMFGAVFADNLKRSSLSDVALHLLEEMGEVSNALARTYSYSEHSFVVGGPNWKRFLLEEELSDVLSRLFAIVERLSLAESGGLGNRLLSQIIWQRYGSEDDRAFICWKCKAEACSCSILMVPRDRSVEVLRSLVEQAPL